MNVLRPRKHNGVAFLSGQMTRSEAVEELQKLFSMTNRNWLR